MIKYARIIDEETKICEVGLGDNVKFYESLGMEEMEVELAYNGSWYVSGYAPEEPTPTEEEQRQKRADAYQREVDPITSHIERLKDEEQTPEIEQEINDLKEERYLKVQEIKEKYPYPEEAPAEDPEEEPEEAPEKEPEEAPEVREDEEQDPDNSDNGSV